MSISDRLDKIEMRAEEIGVQYEKLMDECDYVKRALKKLYKYHAEKGKQ